MIEKLAQSSGSVVGFAMSGTITPQDYEVLVPEVTALAEKYQSLGLLCDLTDFHSEEPTAWLADLRFGREFHGAIAKMAIVGDSRLLAAVTTLAAPLYAKSARHFTQAEPAWEWLREEG